MSNPPSSRLERLADALVGRRVLLFFAGALLTLLAFGPASRLAFDQSIESLYAPDNPHLQAFLKSKRLFGGDEFVMVAFRDPQLLDKHDHLSEERAEQLSNFAEKLASVPGVQSDSVQHLAAALRFPYQRARVREFVEGALLGADRETTAVVVRLTPVAQAPVPRGETFAEIRQLAAEHNPPAFVVGEPVQVHDMFRYVEEDGAVLGMASSLLLMAVILALFRNLRWMLLPLLVVHATLLWTKAILVLSRMQLSMVSSMLNSLVTIIAIATVMHVTVRYREYRRACDHAAALRRTIASLAPPIFWTCTTTATGFAALLSSHITPVQSFGIMMSLATLLVMLAAATLLPGGILLGRAAADPGMAPAENRLASGLDWITSAVERRPLAVSGGAAALVAWAGTGFLFLEVETDFSKNFRESSPIVTSLNFVENNLGGAGTWEVNFPAPAELDEDYLDRVRTLTADLRKMVDKEQPAGALTKVISLTDGLDLVPERILFRRLSLDARLGLLNTFQSEFVSSLYNSEQGRMRILLRGLERQPSAKKLALISQVEKTARSQFPDAEATGLFVLLAFLIESLMQDQLVSFSLAAAGILLLMTTAFRSLRIGLISLVPNVFPIVLVIGLMGWIGLPINIATAMIASVSMGLTVDSSIHYISGYRAARRDGLDMQAALAATHQSVGRALVFANVALVAGFSVLTLSNFIPLIYFGILVSVAMIGGLAGNLVLLPLLLRFVGRDAA